MSASDVKKQGSGGPHKITNTKKGGKEIKSV